MLVAKVISSGGVVLLAFIFSYYQARMSTPFDTREMIASIEKHPCIWHMKNELYGDKEARMAAWYQIAGEVLYDFDQQEAEEQFQEIKELQNKWKSIRDCFQREMRMLQTTANDEPRKKKRKYVYFDDLKFMLANYEGKGQHSAEQMYIKEEAGKTDSIENVEVNDIQLRIQNFEPVYEQSSTENVRQQSANNSKSSKNSKKHNETFEESLLKLLEKNNPRTISEEDGDKFFLLSQLPFFRKMSEEMRIWARIEITKIVQKALGYTEKNIEPSDTQLDPLFDSTLALNPSTPTHTTQDHNCLDTSENRENVPSADNITQDTTDDTAQNTPKE